MLTCNIPSCIMIFVGTVVMLVSILNSKQLVEILPLLLQSHRNYLSKHLKLQLFLMVFFLFGYIAMILFYVLNVFLVKELLVSLILMFGALFVYQCISIQIKIFNSMQTTIYALTPICSNCKKIKIKNSTPNNQSAWISIEKYVSKETNIQFTHGLCPECMHELHPNIENNPEK